MGFEAFSQAALSDTLYWEHSSDTHIVRVDSYQVFHVERNDLEPQKDTCIECVTRQYQDPVFVEPFVTTSHRTSRESQSAYLRQKGKKAKRQ